MNLGIRRKKLGEADTGLDWERVLTRLTPEQTELIEEGEYGITSSSYKKLAEAGLTLMITQVDARYHPEFVDKDMRNTVQEVDKLPFAKTSDGCSGHGLDELLLSLAERQKDSEDTMNNPNAVEEWKAIMSPFSGGYIAIYLDEKDGRSYGFANEFIREAQRFAKDNPDLLMKFKLDRPSNKEGVSTIGLRWSVLPSEGWLQKNKGIEDIPNPSFIKSEEAQKIMDQKKLTYPFNVEGKNPWLLYDHIYFYLYHDFYVANQEENKERIQEVFGLIRSLAEKWQDESYDGKIVENMEQAVESFDLLKKAVTLAQEPTIGDWRGFEGLGV